MVDLKTISSNPRRAPLLCLIILVVIGIFTFSLGTATVNDFAQATVGLPSKLTTIAPKSSSSHNGERLAFVTYLARPWDNEPENDMDDRYFKGVRLIGYQLMHAPATRSDIPFVVIVQGGIRPSKRATLERDGAIVKEVKDLPIRDWMRGKFPDYYLNVFTKLRTFELYEYDRVAFIDADGIIFRPLDGLFTAFEANRTLQSLNYKPDIDFGIPQPKEYLVAFGGDQHTTDHGFPPKYIGEINTGFFVCRPSKDLFDYYEAIMNRPNAFDPGFVEQSLLNFIHRPGGNMPFVLLHWSWNQILPGHDDSNHGIASLHEKFWNGNAAPDVLEKFALLFKEMDEFYASRL